MTDTIKRIDIGCGDAAQPGHEPWDIKQGRRMECLEGIADGQLDCIRASHVLEHASHRDTLAVLREWARALRLGGELLVAVPDFDKVLAHYHNGGGHVTESFLMGGHVDADDRHGAIFNRQKLEALLGMACLEVVGTWDGADDCSAYPISLNLRARRVANVRLPVVPQGDVLCVMSMPRLAWSDNMQCVAHACFKLAMPMVRTTGVFWGQCLQRELDKVCAEGKFKYILTVDYDTVFEANDVLVLRHLLEEQQLDVLAPLQVARDRDHMLAMLDDGNGQPLREMEATALRQPWWPCLSAHFGCTLMRVETLAKLPRPLFVGKPAEDGGWGDGRVDDDIYFWSHARAHGLRCGITPLVRVGHLQVMCSWPDEQLQPRHQYVRDYNASGALPWNP